MWRNSGFQGTVLEAWKSARTPQINNMVIITDGSHVVSTSAHKDIHIYNVEKRTSRVTVDERSITSLSISNDESYTLVNLSSKEMHLLDILAHFKPPSKLEGIGKGNVSCGLIWWS